jgi:hypothetical protein
MKNEAIYHKSNIGYSALRRLRKQSLKKDSLKSNILQNDSKLINRPANPVAPASAPVPWEKGRGN